MEDKINMKSEELVALASSLAVCISKKFSDCDILTIRMFLNTLSTNLSLIEYNNKLCCKNKNDKK